jgi:glycosyltransferase involved in cell wall biosynthesis
MSASVPLLAAFPAYEDTIVPGFRLSVLVPVYNERHLIEASLRRLLALEHEIIRSLEVIIVDDRSTDGTREILRRLASEDGRIKLVLHDKNEGKGSAVRTALEHATGDIVVIHDADLEYNPGDIPALLVPFATEGADAVFGSRYLSAPYRRALMYRHTLVNRWLTTLANWLTDLALGHCERYTAAKLRDALEETGFRVETIFDFNRMSVPGWWFNGKVLRKRRLSRVQLKMMELMIPAFKRLDRLWPWRGNSLIGLGVRD